jgi:hypothetical protein
MGDWLRAELQLAAEIAQRRAQPLFDDGVVERHVEDGVDREALLHRPRQQMREMLRARTDHLGAEQEAATALAVDVQQTAVAMEDATAALVGSIFLALNSSVIGHQSSVITHYHSLFIINY